MEKKKMTNKKKFWIGMASLAAVGIITATVAYFSSVHEFDPDTLKSLGYNVSATKLLDPTAVNNVLENKNVDATVKVKNEEGDPILSRITYYWKKSGDESVGPGTAFELNNAETDLTKAGWVFNFVENNGFVFNETDSSYYYKGTIGSGIEVQHLSQISYTSGGESGGGTEYSTNRGESWLSDDKDKIAGTVNGEKQTYYLGKSVDGELTVIVETVQATDKDNAALTVPESATAENLKGYWKELGKENPATVGGM